MWTPEHRRAHDRKALRYPSDLTDEEMGAGVAADPTGPARWPATRRQCAGSAERGVLPAVDGLPVGCLAQRPAAQEHGVRLFLAVALGPDAATTASGSICPGAHGGGP